MTYLKTEWKDANVEHPYTYMETTNADGSITLSEAFGRIEEEGTKVSAQNMNKIENQLEYLTATHWEYVNLPTNTNFNTIITEGKFKCRGRCYNSPLPDIETGWILEVCGEVNTRYAYQRATSTIGNEWTRTYARRMIYNAENALVWSGWVLVEESIETIQTNINTCAKLDFSNTNLYKQLPANSSFNTILDNGVYFTTGTCANSPDIIRNVTWVIRVESNGNTMKRQYAYAYQDYTATNIMYCRTMFEGIWQPWFVVQQNLDTLATKNLNNVTELSDTFSTTLINTISPDYNAPMTQEVNANISITSPVMVLMRNVAYTTNIAGFLNDKQVFQQLGTSGAFQDWNSLMFIANIGDTVRLTGGELVFYPLKGFK